MVDSLLPVPISGKETYRLVNTKFPPTSLFDDVADKEEFESVYALQALTNPRILNELGDLSLLSLDEIPFGINGVNYATAPFTHVTPDGSRFSDGSFGILYLADTPETAIEETRYHQNKVFCNVEGLHYDTVDMRCLKVEFSAEPLDATGVKNIYDPNDYTPSRIFGNKIKTSGADGIQYLSVRNPGAICWGLMSPRFVESVTQTKHFEFIFDGERISAIRQLSSNDKRS